MDNEEMQKHLDTIDSARSTIEQAHIDMKDAINTIEMEVDKIYQRLAEEEALEDLEEEERLRNES